MSATVKVSRNFRSLVNLELVTSADMREIGLLAREREAMTDQTHIHDIPYGSDTCACGWVFRVPPVCVSIEVTDRSRTLVSEGFNCETKAGAIHALRQAADRLERM